MVQKPMLNLFFAMLTLTGSLACQQSREQQFNELRNESSPYLQQHAQNPVNWYPWGEKALAKAEEEGKLLVISIGYAACHWCHVMEEESFEDSVVAKTMNANFVSIKVDREERPDVDQVYIDAATMMTGRAGWPLNIIALPDGRPIYAGTYFKKEEWIGVLNQVQQIYISDRAEVERIADDVQSGVQASNLFQKESSLPAEQFPMKSIMNKWKMNLDKKKGGTKGRMKFPTPMAFQQLLAISVQEEDVIALELIETTLNQMLNGGIYDQIGGGFSRYAVDPDWNVPHFEKMLYDNAQLISLYSQAYQYTHNPNYKRVIEETLSFVERELTDPNGGFYSSLDADSEGEEGKYYAWTSRELDLLLGDNSNIFKTYYGAKEKGNWEGTNVLRINKSLNELALDFNLDSIQLVESLTNSREKLYDQRELRVKPALDNKILTSWNALMLTGYVDAYMAIGSQQYLEMAKTNAEFIWINLQKDGSLFRNYMNSKPSVGGFLDDYAFLIRAYIKLYQATFEEVWVERSLKLLEYTVEHFYDDGSGLFYFKDKDDPELFANKIQTTDEVRPSGNSMMALNLFYLGHYYYDQADSLIGMSEQMLRATLGDAQEYPNFSYNWIRLYDLLNNEPFEVVVIGDDYERVLRELNQHYLPNVIWAGGKLEGKIQMNENKLVEGRTMIYVCRNRTCKLPVSDPALALLQMEEL